jgi:hypothetical protein
VPSAAHDAEAASAVAINREIERIDRWTVKPLADATQRNASAMGRFCFIRTAAVW